MRALPSLDIAVGPAVGIVVRLGISGVMNAGTSAGRVPAHEGRGSREADESCPLRGGASSRSAMGPARPRTSPVVEPPRPVAPLPLSGGSHHLHRVHVDLDPHRPGTCPRLGPAETGCRAGPNRRALSL